MKKLLSLLWQVLSFLLVLACGGILIYGAVHHWGLPEAWRKP